MRRRQKVGLSGPSATERDGRVALTYFEEARRIIAEEDHRKEVEEAKRRLKRRPPYAIVLKVCMRGWGRPVWEVKVAISHRIFVP